MGEIPQTKQHQGSAPHTTQGAETMSELKPRVENEVSSGEDMTSAEEETSKNENHIAVSNTSVPNEEPAKAATVENETETSQTSPKENAYALHRLNRSDSDSESEDESSSDDEDGDLTDVSERFGIDGEEGLGRAIEGDSSHLVPQINVVVATDVSTDDERSISSHGSSNRSNMKKNLLEQLRDANTQLQEERTKNKRLQVRGELQ